MPTFPARFVRCPECDKLHTFDANTLTGILCSCGLMFTPEVRA